MLKTLERYQKCNYGAPEPNISAREALSFGSFEELSSQQEYLKLKARFEALQRTQRNLLGEDLGPLNSKELESLERQLDMSLKQIRSTRKQKDVLAPEKQEVGNNVMWTSGIIFGRGEGIVGLETEYGTLHIKLLPECSPHSVAYILELLSLRHCAGCQFYRAEGRGQSWDINGNHIQDASFGPPFALIQGTLEAQGQGFNQIQSEHCPTVKRGSVAWVGSGPEFFISLAHHQEWRNSYTVFGSVLPEDMVIAEKIARLPTKSDVWNNIDVSVLEKTVPLKIQRVKIGGGD
ncbi:hypothetical protein CASFOL_000321 [Castilleja foliolosa]|uniref:K-box domain-containing protein n=1 Tax=Castilleja foliolosa TaxID=1961234 RepID=A0ABD3EP06_9LAMI